MCQRWQDAVLATKWATSEETRASRLDLDRPIPANYHIMYVQSPASAEIA